MRRLFEAYIRPLRFEKLNGRDATYVRIRYEGSARGGVVGGFACINYFFVHDDDRKSHMLATASVDVRLVRDAAPVHSSSASGTRGRG